MKFQSSPSRLLVLLDKNIPEERWSRHIEDNQPVAKKKSRIKQVVFKKTTYFMFMKYLQFEGKDTAGVDKAAGAIPEAKMSRITSSSKIKRKFNY